MISKGLKKIILDTLRLDDWDIQDRTLATEVPGWDSLRHVDVIMAVEKGFGIRFKSVEVLKLKNIGDLQSLVDLKLGEKPQ
jgi:acyl carrier protein